MVENEDEVIHLDLVGKRKVYSEENYNKVVRILRDAADWAETKIVDIECAPCWYLDAVNLLQEMGEKKDEFSG